MLDRLAQLPLLGWTALLLTIPAVWLLGARWLRSCRRKHVFRALAQFNRSYGTTFPTETGFKHPLVLGIFGRKDSYCLIFDVAHRKVAITRADSCQIADLDFLREWQLGWVHEELGGWHFVCDPHLTVYGPDPAHAGFKAMVPNLQVGKAWEAQLALLIASSPQEHSKR